MAAMCRPLHMEPAPPDDSFVGVVEEEVVEEAQKMDADAGLFRAARR